jgi:hypothetical protein
VGRDVRAFERRRDVTLAQPKFSLSGDKSCAVTGCRGAGPGCGGGEPRMSLSLSLAGKRGNSSRYKGSRNAGASIAQTGEIVGRAVGSREAHFLENSSPRLGD